MIFQIFENSKIKENVDNQSPTDVVILIDYYALSFYYNVVSDMIILKTKK